MKHTQPIVAVLESDQDVQTFRDSTGIVLEVGNAVLKGDCAGSPTGIRIFPNELELWAFVLSESVGEKLEVTRASVEVLVHHMGELGHIVLSDFQNGNAVGPVYFLKGVKRFVRAPNGIRANGDVKVTFGSRGRGGGCDHTCHNC